MKWSFELARRMPHGETVLPYLLATAAVIALGVVVLVMQVLVIFITESWFDFLTEFAGG